MNPNNTEKTTRRIRGDAFWNRLTAEQRKKINDWLHEEKLTHREAHKRARAELGVNCSLATISRYYQYGLKFRASDEVAEGQSAAKEIAAAGASLDDLRSSSMHVIATRLLEKAMDHGEVKDLAALGRIVLEGQDKEIQLKRVALACERFKFNASKAALAALPLAEQLKTEELEREEENVEAVQRTLFGKELDKIIE
jgi:hypothetical protein